jgi:FKBP-type peptidyl-prolyl cis-trans isomerase
MKLLFQLFVQQIKKMGFEKKILKAGNGTKVQKGQTVTVHCTGFGKNNNLQEKFWSTKDPGQNPFTFQIGQGKVIKGWDEGVLTMVII